MVKPYNRLYETASIQQGYFTAKQANQAGYKSYNHSYYVKSGDWIREHRGIYRLSNFPPTDRPDLVLWSLWSMDRRGNIRGVYSHQTALGVYDLSELMPSKLHMTVPPNFRRMAPIPKVLILYRGNVNPAELEIMEGFKVTRPLRTILDIIGEDTVQEEFVFKAVQQGWEKGYINSNEIDRVKTASRSSKEKLKKMISSLA